jgi:phage terminase small subunit
MAKAKPLNPREQAFVDAYLISLNAADAARKAGYSPITADKNAPLWTGKNRASCPKDKLHVWDAVKAAGKARSERTQIDADYVLIRHAAIDQMNAKDILDSQGALLPIHEWPDLWTTTLSGMEISEIYEEGSAVGALKKIKWPDKLKNLELLGKHATVGAYRENINLSSDDALTKRILAGRDRAGG